MSRLECIIREVHRRVPWRIRTIYVATSWGVFEVVGTSTDP